MRTVDHLLFARLLADRVLDLRGLKKAAFVFGNISPDINYLTYLKKVGHGFSSAKKNLAKSVTKKGLPFYYTLGKASHYLCDSFTFPHNEGFKGNLRRHLSYENRLHKNLSNGFRVNSGLIPVFGTLKSCGEYLTKAHKTYLTQKKSPLIDISWITAVCQTAMLSVIKLKKSASKI